MACSDTWRRAGRRWGGGEWEREEGTLRGDLKGRGRRGERKDGLKWERKEGERRGKG